MPRTYRLILFVTATLTASSVHGQFATVINVPPDAAPTAIDSNTQLNLGDGGLVASSSSSPFSIGSPAGTSVNVEMNITGGMFGSSADAFAGSTVNVSGGRVLGDFESHVGSVVNVLGGEIDPGFDARSGSVVNIAGGSLDADFFAHDGSVVNISGGLVEELGSNPGSVINITGGLVGTSVSGTDTLGELNISGGAFGRSFNAGGGEVKLIGNEFRIDGTAIPVPLGVTSPFNVSGGGVLSGTFADGTPFAFTIWNGDSFAVDSLKLMAVTTPAVGPAVITSSTDPVPLGIREGQQLIVDDAGSVGPHFNAGRGSTVTIEPGGVVGDNLKAITATVNVQGGTASSMKVFAGSLVNVDAGSTTGEILSRESVVNIEASTTGYVRSVKNSTVNVDGDIIGGFDLSEGSTLNFHGGSAQGPQLRASQSTMNIFGGTFSGTPLRGFFNSAINVSGGSNDGISVLDMSVARISGGAFGPLTTQVGAVTLVGGEFRIDGSLVPGLGAVGNIVNVALPEEAQLTGTLADGTPFVISSTDDDLIGFGGLKLQAASLPPVGPSTLHAPGDSIPYGIRQGQTLTVAGSGVNGVAKNFTAGPGSAVVVEPGGAVGDNFEAAGALVTIRGSVGLGMDALAGSEINVLGGAIGVGFTAHAGSVVNILGGSLGAGFMALADSEVNLFGSSFAIDGVPVTGLQPGDPFTLATRAGTLTGTLADGSPFSLPLTVDSRGGAIQMIADDALLTLTLVPEPASIALAGIGAMLAIGLRFARRG